MSGGKISSLNGARQLGLGPSDGELDDTNRRLSEFQRVGGLKAFCGEGEIILNDIFNGDSAAWESRSPAKMNSLRRLAKRPGAPYERDALTKRVGVFLAMKDLDFAWTCSSVFASHIVAVLGLPPDERARMLKQVQVEELSVRSLREKVIELRRGLGERRGRHVSPQSQKGVVRLRRAVILCEQVVALLGPEENVGEGALTELLALLTRLRKFSESLERRLLALVARSEERAPAGGVRRVQDGAPAVRLVSA